MSSTREVTHGHGAADVDEGKDADVVGATREATQRQPAAQLHKSEGKNSESMIPSTALLTIECHDQTSQGGALSSDESGGLSCGGARGDHVVDDQCAAG